jgi:hypothetical protein
MTIFLDFAAFKKAPIECLNLKFNLQIPFCILLQHQRGTTYKKISCMKNVRN